MQRSLECQLARNEAVGFAAPELAFCPLASPGVHAVAHQLDGRVAVEIAGNDARIGAEVLRRARQLLPPPGR
jgi:hypothetical protein